MNTDTVALLISYSCAGLGAVMLAGLAWVSERHGPDLSNDGTVKRPC